LNASLHCRCEPARQRRVERAALLVLAALVAWALSLSALHWTLGAALWVAAAWLGILALRQPVPTVLSFGADGMLRIAMGDDAPGLSCVSARAYGPWLIFELADERDARRRARLVPGLLAAEQRRQLGRMLARLRPAPLPSV
jgi:hypothetical protein